MKFSQVIEYDKRNIFLQKSCRKWNRKTSYRLLLFKEAWYEVKASGLQLSFNMFWQSSTWHTIKTSYTLSSCMNIDPEICSILVFRKGSGNSISIAFCVWFKKKKFLVLHSINWPNIIAWSPLHLEIYQYVYCNCLLTRLSRHKSWN